MLSVYWCICDLKVYKSIFQVDLFLRMISSFVSFSCPRMCSLIKRSSESPDLFDALTGAYCQFLYAPVHLQLTSNKPSVHYVGNLFYKTLHFLHKSEFDTFALFGRFPVFYFPSFLWSFLFRISIPERIAPRIRSGFPIPSAYLLNPPTQVVRWFSASCFF
ncbi:hypothetical protein CSKR_200890 [Clonorchis sinensis]|uniref:Uncharacterized protein n=1 Tax=Clonorchis sinensis TaxID=79923 RepID=A0A8T1MJ11_CLOSI|nr:hypothetical protein CSKR_200890 [Clonorchis sinensis]